MPVYRKGIRDISFFRRIKLYISQILPILNPQPLYKPPKEVLGEDDHNKLNFQGFISLSNYRLIKSNHTNRIHFLGIKIYVLKLKKKVMYSNSNLNITIYYKSDL